MSELNTVDDSRRRPCPAHRRLQMPLGLFRTPWARLGMLGDGSRACQEIPVSCRGAPEGAVSVRSCSTGWGGVA